MHYHLISIVYVHACMHSWCKHGCTLYNIIFMQVLEPMLAVHCMMIGEHSRILYTLTPDDHEQYFVNNVE